MQLRVFVVGRDDALRDSISLLVNDLGHSAIVTSEPTSCPHYQSEAASCKQESACGDAIIMLGDLPALKSIEFIKRKLEGGCKGAAHHKAIILGDWAKEEKRIADELGCQFFETPLSLKDIGAWLQKVGKSKSELK